MKDVYAKNDKTWLKEIKDDLNTWKDSGVHGQEELMVSRCPYYLQRRAALGQFQSKFQEHF